MQLYDLLLYLYVMLLFYRWTSLVDKDMRHGHARFHKLLAFAYFEGKR